MQLLLTKKAKVNAADPAGLTPLHKAAAYGHAEIVEELLKYDADVYAKTKTGKTAEDVAFDNNHREIGRMLMKRSIVLEHSPPSIFCPHAIS